MSLEVIRSDLEKLPWIRVFGLLLLWILWMSFVSQLPVSSWLKLPMTGLIVVIYSQLLSWVIGGLLLFLLAWIYHQWALVPPGLFWLSCFLSFLILKAYCAQLELSSFSTLAIGLVLAFSLIEVFQLTFLLRTGLHQEISLPLLGWTLASIAGQSLLALLVYRPLKGATP